MDNALAHRDYYSGVDTPRHTKFIEPEIYRDQNGRTSHVFSHRSIWSWQGHHHYACGVVGSYTTYAYYDFGNINRQQRYELYAYLPGGGASTEDRNNGYGSYSLFINGTSVKNWRVSQQFGGWRRLTIGKIGNATYNGRHETESRYLATSQRLQLTIHNGGQHEEGTCSPGSRVVFPPLFLVGVDDYPDSRPFDPAYDPHPYAVRDFYACVQDRRMSDLERDLTIGALIETITDVSFGIGNLRQLERYREIGRRINDCEIQMGRRCSVYNQFGVWHNSLSYPNTSTERLFDAGPDWWFCPTPTGRSFAGIDNYMTLPRAEVWLIDQAWDSHRCSYYERNDFYIDFQCA